MDGATSIIPTPKRTHKFLRFAVIFLIALILGYGVYNGLHKLETPSETSYTGYVVSDNLYMSSSTAGELQVLCVKRGQEVKKGDKLFALNSVSLSAQVGKIKNHIEELEASIIYHTSIRERARANLIITESDIERTHLDYERYSKIWTENQGAISRQTVDHARIAYANARSVHTAQTNDIHSAEANIVMVQAQVKQAQEDLIDAKRKLSELTAYAPTNARVEDTLYQQGEWINTNSPVVSLVPHNQVKVRFYVPQGEISLYPIGTRMKVTYDGNSTPQTATVDYISTRPEYTPPVIYSLQCRDKLVFLVEAVPEDASKLTVGQPLDVRPINSSPSPRQ